MPAAQPKRSRKLNPDHVIMAKRVIATVLLPWLTAKFLLKPQVGPLRKDRVLDRLTLWRAVVGLLVIVVTTSRWRSTGDVVSSTVEKTWLTAGYAAVMVPLPFLVLLLATRSGNRTQLLRGALHLLKRAAFASTGLLVFLGILLIFGRDDGKQYKVFDVPNPDLATFLLGALAIAGIVAGFLWLWLFILCTFYWAARTGFWLSEIHPLLGPVGTTCVMLVISGQELIGFDTEGVPSPLWLTLNLCGVATALALSVFEYRHLRSIGYRFRAGPQPAAMDADQTHRIDATDGPTVQLDRHR